VNTSWRVDETYIKVRGKWTYLYRAVDNRQNGRFSAPSRSQLSCCSAFFRNALFAAFAAVAAQDTLDGLKQSHVALRLLRREDPKWKYVQVRCSQSS